MLPGDRQLLGQRVAAEMDHLEAVVQRVRYSFDVVGGGNEEHAAEVVLALEVVVAEARVVRRVEDLHESRRRVAAPVAVELVDLVEQYHRVVDAGLGEALEDAPGQRPDVGAAMPADLGFVAHTAEGDAREGPAQSVGDRLGHAALAGARRAGETQDGGRMVGAGRRGGGAAAGRARVHAHPADGQILEDAVLDVLEAVVRALQMPGDRGHVHVDGRQPAPGEVEDGVEQAADHGDLRAHRRRLPELAQFALDELVSRRRQAPLGEPPRVLGGLLVGALSGLLELVAHHAQLLVQKELALRVVRDEIEEAGESPDEETAEYARRLAEGRLSPAANKLVERELRKLRQASPMSPEVAVIRGLLDTIFDLPWGRLAPADVDVAAVARHLERTHYGLKDVKDRILEYLAVCRMRVDAGAAGGRAAAAPAGADHPATILCLAGPPGTGKSSVAQSIADALGRPFARIALGGVRDEAEIRGHRRTYIGALPGRILEGLAKAGVDNPVILLDEIDKLDSDWRGNPAAALMEVLDPAHNTS